MPPGTPDAVMAQMGTGKKKKNFSVWSFNFKVSALYN
jgi:hypothetical protein